MIEEKVKEENMDNQLDKINSTKDLKGLKLEEKQQLAKEIREFILSHVSKTGGHVASNLGVVELTIALHSIFDVPKDKIIWDVGHQTYTHKILTGRKDKFDTLRQEGGVAGFPKVNEAEEDCFNTGHSSTSISIATGMARVRDLRGTKEHIIAVIGDGALTGGMALEALNDVGDSKTNIIVILNDNTMSISKNVGGISTMLAKLRSKKIYKSSNHYVKKLTKKIPKVGDRIINTVRRIKYSIKRLLIQNMLFEDIGFKYIGPIDGHDIEKLESMLNYAKEEKRPVLLHVVTKKGKGYELAEQEPDRFHSIASFDLETGKTNQKKEKDYSQVFGEKLVELARKNDKIIAITAAMKDGTGLANFAKEFPERFFDIGIAEQHAIGMAAGAAKQGAIPVVPIYSSFYQRAYDQVIHDICIQKLPVVLCVDRAGIVGNDGETHQGILDLSFFNIIPNLNILAPKNFKELEMMLEFAVNLKEPVVIRYPKGKEEKEIIQSAELEKGKAEILKEGKDLSIIAIGKMVQRAVKVQEILQEKQIEAEVINVRFLKPIDEDTILQSIKKTKRVITIEDNITQGGLGSTMVELIHKNRLDGVEIQTLGYPSEFIKHAKVEQIEKKYGLDTEKIVQVALKLADLSCII